MIDRVASWIRAADRVVVLTGAGISAESGVPVFRGAGGLWREFRPEDLATPGAFARQPNLVWEWYLWRRSKIAAAQPNPGHAVIARLGQRPGMTLLTQNVDGLHTRAGSRSVVELHGNLWRVRCADGCGFDARDVEQAAAREQLRCACGDWLRPDVVWFGEPLDPGTLDAATEAAERADVVIVVGTSSVVYPVAALPQMAKQRRARVVEINVDNTPLTREVDAVLRGPAGEVLPALERALGTAQ
ncbi:MAG TPA: NAD-dependent deacylase [Vicinamibacterales bacterium]|nr:NAD-dependent deacylase [Vicinamibacterales bacterium]